MAMPTLGELRFARDLFDTERRPRRPRRQPLSPALRRLFDGAVVLTFVFFLFM
ncbi:MAG: hypothetical protein KBA31_04090 [Alphaproteobacteria bacterium]|nr:hypothetical protein [Alphaproteobacteria bacterium]